MKFHRISGLLTLVTILTNWPGLELQSGRDQSLTRHYHRDST